MSLSNDQATELIQFWSKSGIEMHKDPTYVWTGTTQTYLPVLAMTRLNYTTNLTFSRNTSWSFANTVGLFAAAAYCTDCCTRKQQHSGKSHWAVEMNLDHNCAYHFPILFPSVQQWSWSWYALIGLFSIISWFWYTWNYLSISDSGVLTHNSPFC